MALGGGGEGGKEVVGTATVGKRRGSGEGGWGAGAGGGDWTGEQY